MTTYVPSHIEIDEHGQARIVRRGFKIHVLAALYNQDWTIDELMEQYDLTHAEIYAGLSYYYDHKDAIDRDNREGEALAKQIGVSGAALIERLKARKKTTDDQEN